MKLAFGSLYVCALLVAPALADDAREAVQQGGFLPVTQSPANVSLVRSLGDHDGARRSTVVQSDVQVKLSEKFQAQAGPLATFTSGKVQLTAAVGVAAQRERTAFASDVDVYGGAGVGGVF